MLLCIHNVFQITPILYGLRANLSGKFVDGRRVVCLLHVLIYLIILVINYLAELYFFREKIRAFPPFYFTTLIHIEFPLIPFPSDFVKEFVLSLQV